MGTQTGLQDQRGCLHQTFPAHLGEQGDKPSNRNSLLSSLLRSHNNRVFPHWILSSGNTSHCNGFVLPAQPTRSGSRRAQHRLSTEPAHFRVIYHTHTPQHSNTQEHHWLHLLAKTPSHTSRNAEFNTHGIQICHITADYSVLLFISHISQHHFPHQELFCALFQTKSEIFATPTTTYPMSLVFTTTCTMKYIKVLYRNGEKKRWRRGNTKRRLPSMNLFFKSRHFIRKWFKSNLILQSNQVWGKEEWCVQLTNAENKYTFLVNWECLK